MMFVLRGTTKIRRILCALRVRNMIVILVGITNQRKATVSAAVLLLILESKMGLAVSPWTDTMITEPATRLLSFAI